MVCEECGCEVLAAFLRPDLLSAVNEDGGAAPKSPQALATVDAVRDQQASSPQPLGISPGTGLSLRLYGIA